jgi:hypothetical protein
VDETKLASARSFGQPGTAAAPSLRDLAPAGPLATASKPERIVSVVFDTIAVERAFLLLIDEATGELTQHVARRRDGARWSGDAESNGRAQSH